MKKQVGTQWDRGTGKHLAQGNLYPQVNQRLNIQKVPHILSYTVNKKQIFWITTPLSEFQPGDSALTIVGLNKSLKNE